MISVHQNSLLLTESQQVNTEYHKTPLLSTGVNKLSTNKYASYDKMSSDMDIHFSEWLENELKVRDWSQADLAKKAGISRQVISNYINQNRLNPDEEMLTAIARALGYPPEEVFRAAGLLPPLSDRHAVAEEIIKYKLAELSEEELDDVLAYIEFRQAQVETKKRTSKLYKTREGSTPPETVKEE